MRACHPEPAAAVTLVTTALAATSGRSGAGVAAVAAAAAAGQLSVGWGNDAIDATRDRRCGRSDKPVALGEVGQRTAWLAAGLAALAAVPLSLVSGRPAAGAHLAAVGLGWGYNLGLKSSPLSVLPYAGAFALLPAFVTLGLPGAPAPRWWAPAAGALIGAGAHFANVLPDLDDDLATGVRGLPHRIGAVRSRRAAGTLLVAATATLGFAPRRPGSGAGASAGPAGSVAVASGSLVLAAGVVGAAVLRPGPVGSRRAFRAAIVVAALDVMLLIARGHALR